MDWWPAPRPTEPVDATVDLPGSKSMTNRALVLAALADEPSTIRRPLRARDTELMAAGLRALAADVTDHGEDIGVEPTGLRPGEDIDVGLAGTVMRFLPPVAALADGPTRFDGDARARERPQGPLLDGLRQLGARIEDGGRNALPITVHGTAAGGRVRLDASSSSQFVTALLLAGARFERGITIENVGPPVPSRPHICMSVAMLRAAGVGVDDSTPDRWVIGPGPVHAVDVVVEPDLSNAAPFLAAALVTGGIVRVPGWPAETTQPGAALLPLLATMGARISHDGGTLVVRGGAPIAGLDANLRNESELVPVLAALCAVADRPSRLAGLRHMRGQETDRLAALTKELRGLGTDAEETDDALLITPKPLHGGRFETYADHRMAQAGAVLGLAVDGVEIADIATTGKTLPDFPGMWSALVGSTT
ncbi:MAG: 3-phosphoshikimate 1-carboxyvinyltransferase [Mycobacteriales bacterium]|nr:MAG: 3-phosphoshikimate 1-carboxyvinyltransferase [Pseudonocardiales bacterium]